MGILTEEMKRVVTEIQLCYAATVTPDGKPNLSPKGSITVLSDDELGFADLASPGTIENLRHNPAIELNVMDPFIRRGFRFKGAAKVVKDPEAHGRIAQILGPDLSVRASWLSRREFCFGSVFAGLHPDADLRGRSEAVLA